MHELCVQLWEKNQLLYFSKNNFSWLSEQETTHSIRFIIVNVFVLHDTINDAVQVEILMSMEDSTLLYIVHPYWLVQSALIKLHHSLIFWDWLPIWQKKVLYRLLIFLWFYFGTEQAVPYLCIFFKYQFCSNLWWSVQIMKMIDLTFCTLSIFGLSPTRPRTQFRKLCLDWLCTTTRKTTQLLI